MCCPFDSMFSSYSFPEWFYIFLKRVYHTFEVVYYQAQEFLSPYTQKVRNYSLQSCKSLMYKLCSFYIWQMLTSLEETSAGASKYVLVDILIGRENCLPQYSDFLKYMLISKSQHLKCSSITMNCFIIHFHFLSVHSIFPLVEYT